MAKKYIVIIYLLFSLSNVAFAQWRSYSSALFLEGISHPGIKVSAQYHLKDWEKEKKKKTFRSLVVSPSIGFFYHRRYQSGGFFLIELGNTSTNPKSFSFSYGLGAGFLGVLIPNSFSYTSEGLRRKREGNTYFISSYFIQFGRSFGSEKNKMLFVKPTFLYAVPNFVNGVGYFGLEFGLQF